MTAYTHYRDDPAHTPKDDKGKPIPGGPWVKCGLVAPGKDGALFNSEHGVLAMVTAAREFQKTDADGRPVTGDGPSFGRMVGTLYLAPDTELNKSILQKMGFKKDRDLQVPDVYQQNVPKPIEDFAFELDGPFSPRVQNQISQWLLRDIIFKATGARYRDAAGAPEKTVPKITNARLLATFGVAPTGLIGIIDANGEQYIGRNIPELKIYLEDNGFLEVQDLAVPFSRGEKLIASPVTRLENFVQAVQASSTYRLSLERMREPKSGRGKAMG